MSWIGRIARWWNGTAKSISPLGVGLRAALSGASPGGWASDHREETTHNTSFNYIAIHAIASQVAGATVTVFADGDQQFRNQSRRKSLAHRVGSFTKWKSIYGADDRETDPLPPMHPLVRLLKRPNPQETGANFRYRQAQQIRLTGTCLIWNVPSVSGPACERYVIPTAMASAVAPTRDLPRGGWRINPVASRFSPIVNDGYVDCPSWYRILGQIVDARQVQVIRLPHAWYLDDGQSPLSAGAKWIDAGEAVDDARYHQLRNGIDPSIVWNLPPDVSPDQSEIDRTQAKISAKYGGPENVGRVLVAQNGTTITPLSVSPKEMCYSEGFHDLKSAVLALHQTPPVAVGLQEPGAYAAYNASIKAWRHSAIQPLCDLLAESDTEWLAPQFGAGLTVEIESDTVDDTDLIERQLQNDLAAKVRTKNEWRAVRGMKPLPGQLGEELVGTDAAPSTAGSSDPSRGSESKSQPANFNSPDHTRGELAVRMQTNRAGRNGGNDHERPDPSLEESLPDHFDGDDRENSFRAHLIAELLYAVYLASNAPHEYAPWTSTSKAFDPSKHPRDKLGRFAVIGTPEEIAQVRENVGRLLRGEFNTEIYLNVSHNLRMLSTHDLVSLHQEHGIVPPPRIRAQLLRSVHARLTQLPPSDARAFRRSTTLNNVHTYLQDPEELHRRVLSHVPLAKRRTLTPGQWGDLVGAQPNAHVFIYPSRDSSGVEFFVDHPDYRARRVIRNGVIHNVEFRITPRKRGSGLATRVIQKQVEAASKLGFRSIQAGAAGKGTNVRTVENHYPGRNSDLGGYYVWARLGFDGRIDSLMKDSANSDSPELRAIAADFAKKFPGVKRVSQLMGTSMGRKWWKTFGGYFEGSFHLKKRSTSRQVLGDYLTQKSALRKKKALSACCSSERPGGVDLFRNDGLDTERNVFESGQPQTRIDWFEGHPAGFEHHDLLTPEDEQILDQIWDRIGNESTIDRSDDTRGLSEG
jgi:phage portal protein BeeE